MPPVFPRQNSSANCRAHQACRRRFASPCLHAGQCRDETFVIYHLRFAIDAQAANPCASGMRFDAARKSAKLVTSLVKKLSAKNRQWIFALTLGGLVFSANAR